MTTPDSSAAVSHPRTDVEPPDDISKEDLHGRALLEAELREAQDRIRRLEQALRAAGRVLQPYLMSTGR